MLLRAVLLMLIVGVIVFALVDCLRQPAALLRGPRLGWVAAIVFIPLFGAVLYLVTGRESGGRGGPAPGPRRSQPIAPDDDPDFLRSLDVPRPKRDPADGRPPGDAPEAAPGDDGPPVEDDGGGVPA